MSWDDAVEFCRRLSEAEGRSYRLPTEAEWEYTCRAGTQTRFCFGDDDKDLGEYAWFRDNAEQRTHPVGQKKPNAWGLYDMHGNGWEWCQDRHDGAYYATAPVEDPHGPTAGSCRVFRGGCWNYVASYCRVSGRLWNFPGFRNVSLGFRLARAVS